MIQKNIVFYYSYFLIWLFNYNLFSTNYLMSYESYHSGTYIITNAYFLLLKSQLLINNSSTSDLSERVIFFIILSKTLSNDTNGLFEFKNTKN